MKMNLVKLRRLIREKIEASFDGVEPVVEQKYPQTFNEFRTWAASLLEKAGASEELVEGVGDLSRTDNVLVTHMYNAWADICEDAEGADDERLAELYSYYARELSGDLELNESVAEKIQNILNG